MPAGPSTRLDTRSNRSNSVGTDGVFSSSPGSSYSNPITTSSTYAASNSSTTASSVYPAPPPATRKEIIRQISLSPLYESASGRVPIIEGGKPVTTLAQARKRVKRVEQELLSFPLSSSASAGSSSDGSTASLSRQLAEYGKSLSLERKLKASEEGQNGYGAYKWETISRGGPVRPVPGTTADPKVPSPLRQSARRVSPPGSTAAGPTTATKSTIPHWNALPRQDTLMPPVTSPAGRRSVSPSSAVSIPAKKGTPTRVSPPPASTTGPGGISYVEISTPSPPPSSTSHHHSHSQSTSKPKTKSSKTASDRTSSQKGEGSSSIGTREQIQLDAAEKARVEATVPVAPITAPRKKSFAKRLFGGGGK